MESVQGQRRHQVVLVDMVMTVVVQALLANC